ncbi:SMI1/KNR4 family protein [Photobacterium sp. 53610]|uniref:SMI1/KNR4 family protein n=1 Tax=Photobacterium sp. 53610 TaxID=3102789 RepID=UPI002EDA6910
MADINTIKNRYVSEFGEEPCETQDLYDIESALGVKLPDDFKKISSFYPGGLLGGVSHHAISTKGEATNIVQETLRIREAIGLDREYVVLAEPAESIIIMKTIGEPAVLWCDAVEVKHINSKCFMNEPDTWNSYSAFFEYLLDEEEAE